MDWKEFEIFCVNYLNNTYGNNFEKKGESDSTESDILFTGKLPFYIEAKMPHSQCGQFVLIPNKMEQKFDYSLKNKSKINSYAQEIMQFMSKNFTEYANLSTKGKIIPLSEAVFVNWIKEYYKNKDVKFFITYSDNFIIFPIERFEYYFNVSCTYRIKKSGSRHLNSKSLPEFKQALDKEGISYTMRGLELHSDEDIHNKRISGKDKDFLIKEDNGAYQVKILSNTFNANVIFSISLKNDTPPAILNEDKKVFEAAISS
nr:hypothetical protein [uncultured Haemophilus sp.]